jgi:serine/threonine protein phosphatase PrpC
LSKDHTPYREDEAERCVASGARILSFGEIDPSTKEDGDSEVEDPPRVWSKHGNYPGTAFTRSIGDAIAEQLGVYAEPELLTLPISPNERLLVLASDGVFDVVSNQDVVNICFMHRNDPAKACGAILDKSHEEWLLNDDCEEDEANYDDMTCVVVYFDHPEHESIDSSRPPPQAQQKARRQGKRVRQKTLENLDEMGK